MSPLVHLLYQLPYYWGFCPKIKQCLLITHYQMYNVKHFNPKPISHPQKFGDFQIKSKCPVFQQRNQQNNTNPFSGVSCEPLHVMMPSYVNKWQSNPVICHYGDPWRLWCTLHCHCPVRIEKKTKQLHMFHALSNLCPSSAFAHLGMYR